MFGIESSQQSPEKLVSKEQKKTKIKNNNIQRTLLILTIQDGVVFIVQLFYYLVQSIHINQSQLLLGIVCQGVFLMLLITLWYLYHKKYTTKKNLSIILNMIVPITWGTGGFLLYYVQDSLIEVCWFIIIIIYQNLILAQYNQSARLNIYQGIITYLIIVALISMNSLINIRYLVEVSGSLINLVIFIYFQLSLKQNIFVNEKFKKLSSKLESNDKLFNNLINILPEGVAILGKSGNLIYSNKSIKRILQVEEEAVFSTLMALKNNDCINQQADGSPSQNSECEESSKNANSSFEQDNKKKLRKSSFFKYKPLHKIKLTNNKQSFQNEKDSFDPKNFVQETQNKSQFSKVTQNLFSKLNIINQGKSQKSTSQAQQHENLKDLCKDILQQIDDYLLKEKEQKQFIKLSIPEYMQRNRKSSVFNTFTKFKHEPKFQNNQQQTEELQFNTNEVILINIQEPNFSFVMHTTYKNDELKSFEIKITPTIINEQPSLIIVVLDITEREQILKFKEIDKFKNSLLQQVSNELRIPINATISLLQSLKQIITEDYISIYLKPALSSLSLLVNLSNDLYDFSQIRSGKIKFEFLEFNLKSILNEVLDLFQVQAKYRQLSLKLEIDSKVRYKNFITDPNRFKQILINLLSTLIKFSFKSCIIIRLEQISVSEIKFQLQDKCPLSMNTEEQRRFINLLYNSSSENEITFMSNYGAGLGLAIAQQLAMNLGSIYNNEEGIQFSSDNTKGSCFSFVIRNQRYDQNQAFDEINEDERDEIDSENDLTLLKNLEKVKQDNNFQSIQNLNCLSKYYIQSNMFASFSSIKAMPSSADTVYEALIIDNNRSLLELKQLLEQQNIKVQAALSGLQAIEILRTKSQNTESLPQRFAIIFINWEISIIDGLDITEQIILLMQSNIIPFQPLIAVTSFNSELIKDQCQSKGIYEILETQLLHNQIQAILKKWIFNTSN